MGQGGLKREIWRCILFTVVITIVGLALGNSLPLLCGFFVLYIASLFFRIAKLENWINQARRNSSATEDEVQGLWKDIAYDIQLLQMHHNKEKVRLQATVDRVQEMTSALADAVILIDVKGNMEWWNSSAEKLFNFRPLDHGHKLTNLIRHPQFIQYFEAKNYQNPLDMSRWQKDQHLEFQVHTFGAGDRLVIARDITRLFKLEQMRKDFVANVSHELRTPLTVIRGYLETLIDSPNVPKAWQNILQQMEQQSQRMTLLINDLIILTKLETDQKQDTDEIVPIKPLIERILTEASAISAGKNLSISATGDSDLGIIGNERELHSAVSNLVINAINYSSDDATIEVRYERTEHGAVINVYDNGIGIDPKHLARITERFYRVDSGRSVASGGTGLGLAIVKHVLLRHHAELRVESQLGKGSEFSCVFPASMTATLVTRAAPTDVNQKAI